MKVSKTLKSILIRQEKQDKSFTLDFKNGLAKIEPSSDCQGNEIIGAVRQLPDLNLGGQQVDVAINPFVRTISTTIITKKIIEFYASHPLVFTPTKLDLSEGTTRDYCAVKKYLKITS